MAGNIGRSACVFVAGIALGCTSEHFGSYDKDGDGYLPPEDCADGDADIYPGAPEICGDGIDFNCDGVPASPCPTDQDADGYTAENDCNDADPGIHPGAIEDCYDLVDDDCNGIATRCIGPVLEYPLDPDGDIVVHGTEVYADMVAFGEHGNEIEDRALFFEVHPGGVVDAADARLLSPGADAWEIERVGADLCLSTPQPEDLPLGAGSSVCFTDGEVRGAVSELPLSAAAYTVRGDAEVAYIQADGVADVDGDGRDDLLVWGMQGMHVVLGDGTPWSGEYVLPTEADLTFGDCVGSTDFCGFARALLPDPGPLLVLSEYGGLGDTVSIYDLPVGSVPTPSATGSVDRWAQSKAVSLLTLPGFAFSGMHDDVVFVATDGDVVGDVAGDPGSGFGSRVESMFDQFGDELLVVAPWTFSEPSLGYVFNLSRNGLPSSIADAVYILEAPYGYQQCGLTLAGGVVHDDAGSSTVVASTCEFSGGLVFVLDELPPPMPLVGPNDIWKVSETHYRIRKWVVDAFVGNLAWIHQLAQTERVKNPLGVTVGWRLHGITPGSPLHRAGLRTGDIVRRINDTSLTSPQIVDAAYAAVSDDAQVAVGIRRDGVEGTIHLQVVP